MSQESTTPDLVELVRRLDEAASRLDFDAMVSFFAPDAVFEGRASGMTLEGPNGDSRLLGRHDRRV